MVKQMNKIEKLIHELCPDGVEFKELGEVCDFRNGFAFKSSRFKTEGSPIIRIGNIQNKTVDLSNLVFFDIKEYKENLTPFEIKNGDVLIAMSGATTGKIGYLNSDEVYYLNQRVGKFEPHTDELNNRFLYHHLLTKSNELYVLAGGGAQPNLSSTVLMKKITIPIPPLAIQEEIVKILDNFTKLEAELEAELEARRKQYEYYRDELLTFGDEVEFKTLGEVITLEYGKPLKQNERDGGNFPVLGSNGRVGFHSSYLINGPCIIIGRKGSAGAVVWEENNCYPIDTTFFVKKRNDKIILKYLFYKFKTLNLTIDKQDGGVPGLNRNDVYKIKIPIPPLPEQERIVSILDKFDTLVNDISIGLPAELNARRKQYEYYRDKLLTFKEAV